MLLQKKKLKLKESMVEKMCGVVVVLEWITSGGDFKLFMLLVYSMYVHNLGVGKANDTTRL